MEYDNSVVERFILFLLPYTHKQTDKKTSKQTDKEWDILKILT